MKVNVVSLMPEMIEGALRFGVVGSAFSKGICLLETTNPRSFATDNHQTVDDRPFGGGDGMLMMAEPLQQTLNSMMPKGPVFFLSPQGRVFDDKMASRFSKLEEFTLICGRYGGVDNRFLVKNKIQELSVGNFVLSGGEPAAICVIDSVVRKIPGVLGHSASAVEDSFAGGLLELPYFTRPQIWGGMEVPPILLSGNHKNIHEYKTYMSMAVTLMKRPDLLSRINVPWVEAFRYLQDLAETQWVSTGMIKKDVLQRIKEQIDG